jgi:hypothetical protein
MLFALEWHIVPVLEDFCDFLKVLELIRIPQQTGLGVMYLGEKAVQLDDTR